MNNASAPLLLVISCCLVSCGYVPVSDALRTSPHYLASGDISGARAFLYGERTVIEFDSAPALLLVKDANGGDVNYEKAGRYYRLGRKLDSFTAWANGSAMTFTIIDKYASTVSPSTVAPTSNRRESGFEKENDLSDPVWKIGVMPGLSSVSVKQDGGSITATVPDIYNIAATQRLGRNTRLLYQIFNQSFTLDASVSNIGQRVSRSGAIIVYQQSFHAVRGWKPWGGAGLDMTHDQYTKRFTIDHEGFLTKRFQDRDENKFGFVLKGGFERPLANDWSYGVQAGFEMPLNKGVQAFTLSFTLMY